LAGDGKLANFFFYDVARGEFFRRPSMQMYLTWGPSTRACP
jgi:hypothetical protein